MKSFHQSGVSLIELLVVIATVGILVALMANLPPSISLIARSGHQSLADQIASKQIEDIRSKTYASLANGDSAITDTRMKLLPSGVGTVSVNDCSQPICDPTDNLKLKQVSVTITWKDAGKSQQVQYQTLVSEGGLK